MKKRIALLLAALMVLGACSSGVKIESSYDTVSAYSKYLEKASGDEDDIEGYIDDSTGEYMVDVYNDSDYFWMGEIVIMDANSKKIGSYETTLVRPHDYFYSYDVLDGVPDTFMNRSNKFYTFTYPDAPVDYSLIYDITSDYSEEWFNVLMDEGCTLENVKAAAQYQYAVNVITDLYFYTYFFYDENFESYYDQEYESYYPDTDSALFGADLDYSAKTITIYENKDGSWEEAASLTME